MMMMMMMQRAAGAGAGEQRDDIALRAGRLDQGRGAARGAASATDAAAAGMQQSTPGVGDVASGSRNGASTFRRIRFRRRRRAFDRSLTVGSVGPVGENDEDERADDLHDAEPGAADEPPAAAGAPVPL